MKKFISILLTLALVFSFAACGEAPSDETFTVGICQLVQHEALDAATEGFKAGMESKLGDKVTFVEQNAAGDSANCSTICNQFVADKVDIIMANATPALLAASAATADIPIVGTSISHYGTALEIDDWNGKTGLNITGTSDLAPLDQQAAMVKELFPDVKKVGILYCSAEPNSVYQANVIAEELGKLGIAFEVFTFSDSNDVASVTTTACSSCDVLYIPTDNTAATCSETINNVAQPAGVPIICGEAGLCKGCGVASLSINYYDIGFTAGEMAAEILTKGTNPGDMDIQFAPKFEKMFNDPICKALGVAIPEDYVAM